jgi:dTDP-4-dehydrorhamnose reductase
MRILITGASGMLGTDVCELATAAALEVLAYDHSSLDIGDAEAVEVAVRHADPDAIVNCAAWTDVDGAESAPDAALVVNRDGAANVARAAAAHGAWMIHISSDYVFDGSKSKPYVESDSVGPLSAYGRSKLEGELAVGQAAPDSHTIVRSSWLFGTAGRCFPKTIVKLAAEREELTVVEDQIGCPTFTRHLASALIELAAGQRIPGVVHIAADGHCSWFELAREIVATAGIACELLPGKTADLDRAAPRPAYSVLRSERQDAPRLPHWREGLDGFMAALGPESVPAARETARG